MEITPEMSGKIIDESHYNFHVTCKAKMINAINKAKDGGDLLKTLAKLRFSTEKKWTKNSCNDPSVKSLLDILAEYKRVERRPSRAKVLMPLIEYAIGLYASDLFFRERGSWFINQIIKNKENFAVCTIPMFADPKNWYPNTRNNTGIGEEGDLYKMENRPDAPSIEQEYMQWYGVDVAGVSIPKEEKERVIKAGQEWLRMNTEQECTLVAEKI